MRGGMRVFDAGWVARIRAAHLAALPLRFLEPPIFTNDGSSRAGGARERGAARLLVPTIGLKREGDKKKLISSRGTLRV